MPKKVSRPGTVNRGNDFQSRMAGYAATWENRSQNAQDEFQQTTLPNGEYTAVVTGLKFGVTKKGAGDPFAVIKFRIVDGDYEGTPTSIMHVFKATEKMTVDDKLDRFSIDLGNCGIDRSELSWQDVMALEGSIDESSELYVVLAVSRSTSGGREYVNLNVRGPAQMRGDDSDDSDDSSQEESVDPDYDEDDVDDEGDKEQTLPQEGDEVQYQGKSYIVANVRTINQVPYCNLNPPAKAKYKPLTKVKLEDVELVEE